VADTGEVVSCRTMGSTNVVQSLAFGMVSAAQVAGRDAAVDGARATA
jgi:hypothetical protein